MTKISEYETLALQKLGESIHQGKWCNDGLVQLIELAGEYLNLQTVPDYAASRGLSYNGAKTPARQREIRVIFKTKFVIDNE